MRMNIKFLSFEQDDLKICYKMERKFKTYFFRKQLDQIFHIELGNEMGT